MFYGKMMAGAILPVSAFGFAGRQVLPGGQNLAEEAEFEPTRGLHL